MSETAHPHLRLVAANEHPRRTRGERIEQALVDAGVSGLARQAYVALLGMADGIVGPYPGIPLIWLTDYFRAEPRERVGAALAELVAAGLLTREVHDASGTAFGGHYRPHPSRPDLFRRRDG